MTVLMERLAGSRRGRYDRRASASERARETRSAILGAVRRCILERSAITVSRLTTETAVGRNTFYSHFADVNAAVGLAVESAFAAVELLATAEQASAQTPYQAAEEFAEQWIQAALDAPEEWRVCCQTNRDRVLRVGQIRVRRLYEVGARAGVFRSNLEPERLKAVVAVAVELALEVATNSASAGTCREILREGALALLR